MDFYSIKDPRPDLVLAPLNLIALFAPIDATPALTLESPTDGSLDVPVAYRSLGHFEKKAGVGIGNEFDSKDIEAYGEPEPIRVIKNKRTTTFEVSLFENSLDVLGIVWTEDFSNITPSEFGGVVLPAPKQPKNIYYRCILLGLDDRNDREVWVYWLLPRVQLEKVDNQTLNDDNVIEYKVTMKASKDPVLGYSVAQGFAGPGWRDIVDQARFGQPLTSLSATPASVSVTVASGASHTAQLVIEGDNGINYTPDCKFESLDPTKATVSASGLVTGVATGSTSVTATKGALTKTITVTVT